MKHTSKLGNLSSLITGATACLSVLAVSACAGGKPGDPLNRGIFQVTSITTGRGSVYPYRIRQVDGFGSPTNTVLNIESLDTLKANVNGNNGVLPVATFSTTAELPDGSPGNQFLHFRFSHRLDVESILSPLLANQNNSGLSGNLNVLAYDPATEATITLHGRGFVGGITYYINQSTGNPEPVEAVTDAGDGTISAIPAALGFPDFAGSNELVDPRSFVFIADADGDLQTLETFPTGVLIRLVVTNAVRDSEGHILQEEVVSATTVGDDPDPPQVLGYSTTLPDITPGNGMTGVDPTTTLLVRFNKPVQPGDVGSFFDPANFTPPLGGLTLNVTSAAQTFSVIYHADPLGYGDFCNYRITPAYNLPGQSKVTVTVQNTTIRSLTSQLVGTAVTTDFHTSDGPGIVNAPVAPDAIYLGIGGAEPGVSVIDLNGFGQGTGDLTNTRYPLNPNIGITGVSPIMAPGTTNLDAGSGGVLTLVKDSNLETRLLRDPIVGEIGDIHIGAPLDLVFNNENINVNTTRANQVNPMTGGRVSGNCITQAPVPNPPPLVFPPPNPNRAIFGQEPTVTSSAGPAGNIITASPPCAASPLNLLVQGNPFATQQGQVGIYGNLFMGTFVGPQPPPASPPPPPPYCPYTSRQQIGHFLYVLDRDNRQILVVNSNRFTILDTIRLSDPVSMAMAPNLTRIAVSNFASSSVSFIDIDPTSTSFNQVVAETRVASGPTGISWQPDGEDVLVVSTEANFMSVISAQDYSVRRSVSGFLNAPIDVVSTPRFVATGFLQAVYYAYVLNANGTIAVYESGPDGVNGIGFNDVIGTVPSATFVRAHSMTYDYASANGALLIGHVDDNGLGQVSRLDLTSSPGATPLNPNSGGFIQPPTFRQKEWSITQRFGGLNSTTPVHDLLSGNSVVDLCQDEMINSGGLAGQITQQNSLFVNVPYGHSGKHAVKLGGALPLAPKLLFIGLSDVGKVDVFEVATGRKVTSIDVPGIRIVSSYWRQ